MFSSNSIATSIATLVSPSVSEIKSVKFGAVSIQVLYEDTDIVVILKPAGVVVNDATSVRSATVQAWFAHYLQQDAVAAAGFESKWQDGSDDWRSLVPEDFSAEWGSPEEIFMQRQGIVHRLDKDTSGVLILAKNPGALVALLAQFKQRLVKKTYVALVHGKVQPDRDEISAPIGRATGRDRKKFQVRPDGRAAVTGYEVLQYWHGLQDIDHPSYQQGFSLVRALPITGRTHQIRVHFAHVGHPLVGDSTYLGKRRAKMDMQWCQRHFLHAASLVLTHPRTQHAITIEAPLAPDLQNVIARFPTG